MFMGFHTNLLTAEVVSPYWHVFHTYMGQAGTHPPVTLIKGIET
jgi:hypothetical protein